jgi:hypothetical protein
LYNSSRTCQDKHEEHIKNCAFGIRWPTFRGTRRMKNKSRFFRVTSRLSFPHTGRTPNHNWPVSCSWRVSGGGIFYVFFVFCVCVCLDEYRRNYTILKVSEAQENKFFFCYFVTFYGVRHLITFCWVIVLTLTFLLLNTWYS